MITKLDGHDLMTNTDLPTFKRQESIFVVLNLALLIFLLLLHRLSSFWGTITVPLMLCLFAACVISVAELAWLQHLENPLSHRAIAMLTWTSIVFYLVLAYGLTNLDDHEDTPYFVLMVVPILQAAFRFGLPAVVAVVGVASYLNFEMVSQFFAKHPPVEISEYVEAGMTSVIFAIVGVLVWLLVKHLHEKEARLARNLLELEQTREKLLREETLAAVGRLSSAIAHEIRNPVAMISSSLAMAARGEMDSQQQNEMYEIAAREASRLEILTEEFLSYARPRKPEAEPTSVSDTLAYVASVCRAKATAQQVFIEIAIPEHLHAEMDAPQIQQALLNLVMNAIDASSAGGTVWLRGSRSDGKINIEIENSGPAISSADLPRIFEPFYTTKSTGTGLGLSITRNIVRAHDSELVLARNQPNQICFSFLLPSADRPIPVAPRGK